LYDSIYSLGFIGLWVAVGTRCLQNSQAACTNLHSRQWCLHPMCLLCWPLYQSRKCKQPFDPIYNFLSFEQGNCWTHPIFLTLKWWLVHLTRTTVRELLDGEHQLCLDLSNHNWFDYWRHVWADTCVALVGSWEGSLGSLWKKTSVWLQQLTCCHFQR
jgi:hypothetical protein